MTQLAASCREGAVLRAQVQGGRRVRCHSRGHTAVVPLASLPFTKTTEMPMTTEIDGAPHGHPHPHNGAIRTKMRGGAPACGRACVRACVEDRRPGVGLCRALFSVGLEPVVGCGRGFRAGPACLTLGTLQCDAKERHRGCRGRPADGWLWIVPSSGGQGAWSPVCRAQQFVFDAVAPLLRPAGGQQADRLYRTDPSSQVA
jgi:hypothetical protein